MNIKLTCPITAKTFEPEEGKGIPYGTQVFGKDKGKKPHTIFFSPYSQVGIAYPPLSENDLSAIYEQGEYWHSKKEESFSPRTSPGLYALGLARWLTVEPFIENKDSISILDIGGGHGYFGMAAVRTGKHRLETYAVAEMDEIFRRSLARTWRQQYPQTTLQVDDLVEKFHDRYDIVVLSHILEHLNDPRAMLLQAAERMKPDGLLFVDVPHEDYRFKRDVFPHVLFYNPASLSRLVESVGLRVLSVGCYGKDMKISPINYLNEKNFASFVSRVLYKTRYCWPAGLLTGFYSQFFGAAEKNENGTWIRLIAKGKGKS